MNKKLLPQIALDWITNRYAPNKSAFVSPGEAAWLAIAFSRSQPSQALHWLTTAVEASPIHDIFEPKVLLQGWILGHLYQTTNDKPGFLKQIRPIYDTILTRHRSLYANCDQSGDGLIVTSSPESSPTAAVELPLPNTLLIASNEQLMRLGGLLRVAVHELIEWHDLGTWSMNEKLWDEETGRYLSFELSSQSKTATTSISSFLPMFAGIPTQEQAELMLEALVASPLETNDLGFSWLLYKGLLRYEMREVAALLKQETLNLVLAQPIDNVQKAAICVEWLGAKR